MEGRGNPPFLLMRFKLKNELKPFSCYGYAFNAGVTVDVIEESLVTKFMSYHQLESESQPELLKETAQIDETTVERKKPGRPKKVTHGDNSAGSTKGT